MKKHKIVCFGGGTGLSELLKGLKLNPWLDISAVVTMFDSGGSSRVLRDRFGVLPSGDINRCVLALTPQKHEPTLREIFDQRLKDNHTPLNVWSIGAEHIYGDYQTVIDQMCSMFFALGRVFPVSIEKSNICTEFIDGTIVRSETEIDLHIRNSKEDVARLFLDPSVSAHAPAIQAIREAEIICIGPGSFYTSVLPNFLPIGISEAIGRSSAPIIFIENLMIEGLGMALYQDVDYVVKLESHIERSVSKAVINNHIPTNLLESYAKDENKRPLLPTDSSNIFVPKALWLDGTLARHHSARLAYVVSSLVEELLK